MLPTHFTIYTHTHPMHIHTINSNKNLVMGPKYVHDTKTGQQSVITLKKSGRVTVENVRTSGAMTYM